MQSRSKNFVHYILFLKTKMPLLATENAILRICFILVAFQMALAAIGDSRLRVVYSIPRADSKALPSYRLYDPLTNVVYHKTTDAKLIEALTLLHDAQPNYCGKKNKPLDLSDNTTKICDPEDIIPPSQVEDLRKIVFNIPRVTGCQCDSFQHCNHYESGFSVFMAVVPTILRPPGQILNNSRGDHPTEAPSIGRATTSKIKFPTIKRTTTNSLTRLSHETSQLALIEAKVTVPEYKPIEAVNLIVPRSLSGQTYRIIREDANVYELMAHYLRALWSTGSCDEDLMILFFPKEKKIAISVGVRLLEKMTTSCVDALYADTIRKMAEPSLGLSPQAVLEQKKALAAMDEHGVEVNSMTRAASIAKRQQKERLRMTTLFKTFAEDISDLITSRSTDPCAVVSNTKWSNFEISTFAVISGIGLSIFLAILLRLCGILSDFIDRLIEDSQVELAKISGWNRKDVPLVDKFRRCAQSSDMIQQGDDGEAFLGGGMTNDIFDCEIEPPSPFNTGRRARPMSSQSAHELVMKTPSKTVTLKESIDTVIIERVESPDSFTVNYHSASPRRPTAV